jgi:hypothetical protein
MIHPRDKYFSRKLIETHPGLDRIFIHCLEQWGTSAIGPPVLMCPKCNTPVFDQNADLNELIDFATMLIEIMDLEESINGST